MRILIILAMFFTSTSFAETSLSSESAPKEWYERIRVRGYAQMRYNRLLETNRNLKCDSCDKSLGDNGGFLLRRGRLVFSGEMGEYGSFYIQPDYSSSVDDQHYLQLRSVYFDLNLSTDRAHRLRVGQNKVPYGFESLQSSSRRLALDRNEAFSSERDLGLTYYWATPEKRKLLSELTKNNLKGTGDYGLFGFALVNGQGENKAERNNDLHVAMRLTYPMRLSSGQVIEPSIQGYRGKYVANTSPTGAATYEEFLDERVAASFVFYPQPFGFQAEYNIGRGPEFNEAQGRVTEKDLQGGYIQFMYNHQIKNQSIIPFIKLQRYEGGQKYEKGAPSYDVTEAEFGAEWQPNSFVEITALWAYGDRRLAASNQIAEEYGSRLRLQLQLNY